MNLIRSIARNRRGFLADYLAISRPGIPQSIASLADQAISSATNFATGVIIARACSKADLGLYMLGYSVVLLAIDLQTSLIATPYLIYAPRLKGDAHKIYTGSTLIHQTVLCLVTSICVLCSVLVLRWGIGNHALIPIFYVLAVVSTFILFREYVRRISFANLKPEVALAIDVTVGVLQLGGLLILARLHLLVVVNAYWVIGFSCATACLCWLWFSRRSFEISLRGAFQDIAVNWKLGRWIFAGGLLHALSMNVYPWLLTAFHGPASAGTWAACLGVVSAGNPLLLGLQNIVGPKLSHVYASAGHRTLKNSLFKFVALMLLPMLLVCMIIFVAGNRLIVLLYGFQYGGNGRLLDVLALYLISAAVAFPLSRALFAAGAARKECFVNGITLGVTATLGVVFVRTWGPLGAAISFVTASLAATVGRSVVFWKLPVGEARSLREG